MYELFIFQTLVDREAPDIEHEPVTMNQHDQQSRWKAWMRLLAVDIRPISMSTLRKPTSLSADFAFDRRHETSCPLRRDETAGGAPDLRLTLFPTGS
jgi:hypothetical protein